MLTQPRVLLETDADLAIGEFGIAARVAQPEELAPAGVGAVRVSAPTEAPAAAFPVPPTAEAPAATVVYRPDEQPEAPPKPEPREQVTLSVDGRALPLAGDRVVIGRSRECDIRLDDGNVSRRHVELVREGPSEWVLVDLGSTNGTEVNGRKVQRRTVLDDGDRITIGSTELVFGRSRP
jgi:hypothetical protein